MDPEQQARYDRLIAQGLTDAQARRRLEREASVFTDTLEQVLRGGLETGTGIVGGLGFLTEKAGKLIPGQDPLERFGRGTQGITRGVEEALARRMPADTAAGTVARFGGRLAGEAGLSVATLGGSAALASRYAPKALQAAQALTKGSRLKTGGAMILAEAPTTSLLQASAEAARGGDFGTAYALEAAGSGLGGALSQHMAIRRAAAREAAAMQAAASAGEEIAEEAPTILRSTPSPEAIDAEDYINIERFSGDPEVQRRLREATETTVRETDVPLRYGAEAPERLRGTLREPESFKDVERDARALLANELGIDVGDIVTRTADGQRIRGAELLAIRSALKKTIADENEIFRQLAVDPKYVEPDARRLLETQLLRVQDARQGLMNSFMKQRTFAGRDLNVLKMAALEDMDEVSWNIRIADLAKRELTDGERALINNAVNSGDTDALIKIANATKESTLWEKVAAFFKAGLLLQPKTHIANVSGNTLFGILETAKDVPASILDRTITAALARSGRGTGLRTKDFTWPSRRGAARGFNEARMALRGDPTQLRDLTRWDLGRETNYNNALADLYTKGVFRALDAEDRFFRGIAYQRSLEEQAKVIARNEGLRGDALRTRAAQLINTPSDEMVLQSIEASEYAVFQDKSWAAERALKFRDAFGKVGEILMPFVKTPANIAARIMDYSPAASVSFLTNMGRLLKDPNNLKAQKAAVEAFGRGSTGTVAMLTGYWLAKEGKMTGLYPADARTQNEWAATGKQEGSFLYDGNYYNLTRISPLGNLMAIGAQLYEIKNNTRLGDLERSVLMATTPLSALADLPMTATLRDAVDGITSVTSGEEGGAQAFARTIGRTAQAAIPGSSLLRGVAYGIDPVVRETRSAELPERIKRQVMTQIPGLSQRLPERIDPLGQTMMRESGLIGSLANPLTPRKSGVGDPVREEIDRLNISIPRLSPRKGESGEDFEQRSRVYGDVINTVLQAAVSSPIIKNIQNIDTASLKKIPEVLAKNGFTNLPDLSNVPDDKIRDRVLRYVYESIVQEARSRLSDEFPTRNVPGQVGAFYRSLGQK